jgi:hypothetical protein
MAAFRTSWLREWRQTDEVTFSGQKSPPETPLGCRNASLMRLAQGARSAS